MLTILFGVDIRYAIGASLVCVIGTSSGAAAAYVKEGFTNIRIGMFLEIAETCGAIFGAFLAASPPPTSSRSFSVSCCSIRHFLQGTDNSRSSETVTRNCVANWLRLKRLVSRRLRAKKNTTCTTCRRGSAL